MTPLLLLAVVLGPVCVEQARSLVGLVQTDPQRIEEWQSWEWCQLPVPPMLQTSRRVSHYLMERHWLRIQTPGGWKRVPKLTANGYDASVVLWDEDRPFAECGK